VSEQRDGNTAHAAGDLAAELRRLLRLAESRSGAPVKVNALAKKLHVSPSSLYAYLDGSTLPSHTVLDQLLFELQVTDEERRQVAARHEAVEDARRTRRKRGTARSTPAAAPVVSPFQLPPDVRGFTGRCEQLAALDALLADREESTAAAVAVVCGTPGVGKTALVVHWAHKVRGQFPDGLLYVDLRGFDPQQPLDPAEVLGSFLRALSVAGDTIPRDLAERATLFRSQLDRRRILVILDNAASEEQVRHLLPNSSSCLTVVTSRNNLTGLVAREGALRIPVGSLPLRDAVVLLRALLGAERVDADRQGAAALAERCARLPLAIRIGADLAFTRRRAQLTELAAELHRYHLDLFNAGGDERTAIRTVFSWSYLHLRDDRARAFRLLGLHPGHDVDGHACAAIFGVDLGEAALRLDDLVRANLLEEAGHRRYRMHDLLRAYAREQITDREELTEGLRRMFDHYMCVAAAAMDILAPYDRYHRLTSEEYEEPDTPLPLLSDAEAALEWLDAERHNLLTLAEFAAQHGATNRVVQLSGLLARYLDTRGYYADAMALHTLALGVAQSSGNPLLEGLERYRIGTVHMRLGHHVKAHENLLRALTVAQQTGDRVLESRTLNFLGLVSLRLGDNHGALAHLMDALPIAAETGNRYLEGHVLANTGFVHRQLGHDEEAITAHRRALVVARAVDRELEAHVLNSLGLCHQRLGEPAEALSCHRRALAIATGSGNRGLEADTLKSIGNVQLSMSRCEDALEYLSRALTIAIGIGQRDIEGYARRALGQLHARSRRPSEAMTHLDKAVRIARDTGNRDLEVEALNGCGEALSDTRPQLAADHHELALEIAQQAGNPWQQACSHDGAAHAYDLSGRPDEAHEHRSRAKAIYSVLGR
jgi:tetratricopeptide (TPR) repeat protein